jgi:hypothetical protein
MSDCLVCHDDTEEVGSYGFENDGDDLGTNASMESFNDAHAFSDYNENDEYDFGLSEDKGDELESEFEAMMADYSSNYKTDGCQPTCMLLQVMQVQPLLLTSNLTLTRAGMQPYHALSFQPKLLSVFTKKPQNVACSRTFPDVEMERTKDRNAGDGGVIPQFKMVLTFRSQSKKSQPGARQRAD